MDPNLLKHIEYFLEPNSQVRTPPRCPRNLHLSPGTKSCRTGELTPVLTPHRLAAT